jgi:hypothetical protein
MASEQRKAVDNLMKKAGNEGGGGGGGGGGGMPRGMSAMARVKNKQPAPVQITAEQILREAKERQETEAKPPKSKITDADELAEYRLRKRKEFEDGIRRNRCQPAAMPCPSSSSPSAHPRPAPALRGPPRCCPVLSCPS